jgi:hypothetical protein
MTHTMVIMTYTKLVIITKHKTLKGHITLVVLPVLIEHTKLKVISTRLKVVKHKRFKVIRRAKVVVRTRLIPLTEHTILKVIPRTTLKVILVERIRPKVIGRIEPKVVTRTELKVIGRILLVIGPLTKVSELFVSQQPGIRLSLGLSPMEYTLHICPGTLGERIRSNILLHNSL